MGERFCLKWNDFQSNISNSFAILRTETQLFDVTLVGQDQRKVPAHRLVLSACSDFFKSIFYSNTHSHPMLYLDGVDSDEINLMLDYIYKGEVKIMQDHLEKFLEVANKFKLDGLLGSNKDKSESENVNQEEKAEELIQETQDPPMIDIKNQDFTAKPKERALSVVQNSSNLTNVRNVKQLYQELIEKEEGTWKWKCTICKRAMGHKANMERHVEIHMTGLTYECKHCYNIFRSRESLKNHNKKPCNKSLVKGS